MAPDRSLHGHPLLIQLIQPLGDDLNRKVVIELDSDPFLFCSRKLLHKRTKIPDYGRGVADSRFFQHSRLRTQDVLSFIQQEGDHVFTRARAMVHSFYSAEGISENHLEDEQFGVHSGEGNSEPVGRYSPSFTPCSQTHVGVVMPQNKRDDCD
jgi:hypothetical protein